MKLINVGGFGHTGNTALVDFLADSGRAAPIAKGFGESSLFRGRWCLKGALDALKAPDEDALSPEMLRSVMLGDTTVIDSDAPPAFVHDVKRNARIRMLLGSTYAEMVGRLADRYSLLLHKRDAGAEPVELLDAMREEVRGFVSALLPLALRASKLDDTGVVVVRNDPAAYGIACRQFVAIDVFFAVVRNPVDSAREWIEFYQHEGEIEAARMFVSQLRKKLRQFERDWSRLPAQAREGFYLVRFEDLVLSDETRQRICEVASVGNAASIPVGKFDPNVSVANIGVGARLSEQARAIVEACKAGPYTRFLEKFEHHIL